MITIRALSHVSMVTHMSTNRIHSS